MEKRVNFAHFFKNYNLFCISNFQCAGNDETEPNKSSLPNVPSGCTLEATDGWYSIPLSCDYSLLDKVTTGKLKEGTKIVTCAAELVNAGKGCHPLDVNFLNTHTEN